MSAVPRFDRKSRPDLVLVEGGRKTISGVRGEDRPYQGSPFIGTYFLVLGLVLVAPALWYFTLMLMLPLALVGLAMAVQRERSALRSLAHRQRPDTRQFGQDSFGPETPDAAADGTRELELARAA